MKQQYRRPHKRAHSQQRTGPRIPSALLTELGLPTSPSSNSSKHRRGPRLSVLKRKDKRQQQKIDKRRKTQAHHDRNAYQDAPETHQPHPKFNPLKNANCPSVDHDTVRPTKRPRRLDNGKGCEATKTDNIPNQAGLDGFAAKNPNVYKLLVADGLAKHVATGIELQNTFEQDDTDIAYYTKKLGIKKGKNRNSKELHLDGLDDLLDGLLDKDKSLDNEVVRNPSSSIDEDAEDIKYGGDSSQEDAGDVVTLEEMDELEYEDDTDDDTDDITENEDDNDDDDDDSAEKDALTELDDDVKVLEVGVNPDSEAQDSSEDEASTSVQSTSGLANSTKYTPPHLRPQTKSPQYERLRRQLQGLVNRLSDSNIESIISGIESCFQSHPRHDVTEILTNLLVASVAEKIHLLDSFVCTYAALITAIYTLVGTDIGAQMLQSTVEMFLKAQSQCKLSASTTEEPAASARQATNIAALLAYLYNFQLVASVLVYDIVRECITGLSETDVEILLKMLRLCGHQLRSDDPQALKDIVASVQAEASKRDMTSSRLRFLVESVIDLKNNRKRRVGSANVLLEQQEKLTKIVHSILMKRHGHSNEPLRCSLDEIRSVNKRGRWWVVGAAWVGNQHNSPANEPQMQRDDARVSTSTGTTNMSTLVELARKQGMNTEIRRNVFVALMSAEDCADALSRLDALKLSPPRDREAVRVLVHCCTREKGFNPYYALVAQGLVERNFGMKITFQYALWDALKEMDDGGVRRAVHLARLYGYMIVKGGMNLNVLKILNFASLTGAQQIFLTALFEKIFKSSDSSGRNKGDDALIRVLIDGIKDKVVAEGVALFLITFKSSEGKAVVEKRAALFRQRILEIE
ncbi:hypothetical protein SeMB42_g01779 [Synchytrium endobioticum]|uniref:MI domain-containing protein n=1 Tax=Synchytrium endobioticum TaxID=286115 RepID=A0A507DB78_9FUNG|nr:hypothetical protein SeLEV6574_g02212 [Synchytrium endobioticum]TPX51920.1 hypothetical protein SeMB42_g01779 [Synchytrium endobioticum]